MFSQCNVGTQKAAASFESRSQRSHCMRNFSCHPVPKMKASIDHPDHDSYRHFTKRQRIDLATQTLEGILQGITIDNQLNAQEINELINWSNEYRDLIGKTPFNELIPTLDRFLEDGVIDPDEQEDLLWVCKNLAPGSRFYDSITKQIQVLHGILHGLLADDHLSDEEIAELQKWTADNTHLKNTYPYDELESILLHVMADQKVDEKERALLKSFFEQFIEYSFSKQVTMEKNRLSNNEPKETSLPFICAVDPEIIFVEKSFTFTGTSAKGTRKELEELVSKQGAFLTGKPNQQTNYLVVCTGGNPCWAFSCYGRKVETAVRMRKNGHPISIVHESDFWDALENTIDSKPTPATEMEQITVPHRASFWKKLFGVRK